MNITRLEMTAKSPGSLSMESEKQHSAHAEDSNHFASALKNQQKAFHDKATVEEPRSAKQTQSQPDEPIEQKNRSDEHNELVALIEQYLPSDDTGQSKMDSDASVSTLLSINNDLQALPTVGGQVNEQAVQSMLASPAINTPATPNPVQSMPTSSGENRDASPFLSQSTISLGQTNQATETQKLAATDGAEPFSQLLDSVSDTVNVEKPSTELGAGFVPAAKPLDARMETAVIAKPINHPGWSKDLGEQIIWMNNKDISAAEIKLNPLHLGPISVRIDVGEDNQTSILFAAQHAETKDALEASIPKLREMLHGQQLNLVNVTISQHSNPHNSRQTGNPFQNTQPQGEPNLDAEPDLLETHLNESFVNKGLVSLYA